MSHNWLTVESVRVIWGLLNSISAVSKNRDSPIFLGSMFQFSVTLTITSLFLCFNSFLLFVHWNSFCFLLLDNSSIHECKPSSG